MTSHTRIVLEALRGTRDARVYHRTRTHESANIEPSLDAIAQRWPELVVSNDAPVFILSAGWRSGSTLLQRLIMADNLLVWGEPYSYSSIFETLSSQMRAFSLHWPAADVFLDKHSSGKDLKQAWVANLYPHPQFLINAHIAYFDALFAAPAQRAGYSRWGLKEVLLTIDHARYLRWLYPRAKFVFLCRHPLDAWRSYRRWRRWYRRWPDKQVRTPAQFGRLWNRLARDFIEGHQAVNGVLIRYEDLDHETHIARLGAYLDQPVSCASEISRIDGAGQPPGGGYVPKFEKLLLARSLRSTAARLGYHL